MLCRCEDIVEGEPAELLVLCQDDAFMNFKVQIRSQDSVKIELTTTCFASQTALMGRAVAPAGTATSWRSSTTFASVGYSAVKEPTEISATVTVYLHLVYDTTWFQ